MGGTQRSDISGKFAVIIGKGNIGSKIESRLKVFEAQTLSFNSKSSIKNIEQSLSLADIVFLTVPLTKYTKNYFNRERLSMLKKSCILVSISPGEVIDEKSLYKCLKDKKIGGAVLDSFKGEPFDEPSSMFLELSRLKNVFTKQHVAWNTDYSEQMLQIELSRTIESCLSECPINVVCGAYGKQRQ
jgi:phosphoglycerate dehydrogenase-like enzyme